MSNQNANSTNQQHWTSETDSDGIVWLRIDKSESSANVLSAEVLGELGAVVKRLSANLPRGLVIYSGKRSGFIMGADINEFTRIKTPADGYKLIRQGQQVLDELAGLKCPTVAVISGFALGGGLELAMACDYRIAWANKKKILGLPEVQLGIHPGFGGTVRAIQICGVRPAMQMMLTGNPITVEKGRAIGLVDRISAEDQWRQAAKEMIAAARPKQRAPLVERLLNLAIIRPLVRKMLLKQVARKARKQHYPAPYALIDLWSRYGGSGTAAFDAEANSIAELMCTSTSRNLVRVFFLQNALKGQGNKPATKIARVHVVGAGVMGGDIASWCALRGHTVTLQDREDKYIKPALERAQKLFSKRVRNDEERVETARRLTADVNGDGVPEADLVIEAIFEDLEAKQNLYRSLETKMKPGALLATNTSSIRLQDLRTGLREPRQFIGLHFFNPVAQMPLVEVIRCDDTEQESLDIGFAFVKGIGKLPLECASSPGFVVNRILAPYMAEAMHLAQEGVPIIEIDRAAEQFGMPMGPVELVDSVGIDVALHVSKVLGAAMDRPIPSSLATMVDDGQLGRKTGKGFYVWVDGKAQKSAGNSANVPPDIQDRLILSMVNEAVACLHDGVVSDPDLLDAGVIFGTGFAPFRGGPINYARQRGVDEILERLRQLASVHGDRFTPHAGWANL